MSSNETKIRDIEFYVKHSFSCLSDQKFRVLVDDEKMIVTIITKVFDSTLTGWLLTRGLPEDHNVVAFSDDNSGLTSKHPKYRLRIRIGGDDGQEFDTQAVRLATAVWGEREIAITLAPVSTAAVTHDRDVTDLKEMFGESKKVVSIEEMNTTIATRGSAG